MKSKSEWAEHMVYQIHDEDDPYPMAELAVKEIRQEYDKALREVIKQKCLERATSGGSSPHLWLDQVCEIVAETKVEV